MVEDSVSEDSISDNYGSVSNLKDIMFVGYTLRPIVSYSIVRDARTTAYPSDECYALL